MSNRIRVATWNLNSIRIRLDILDKWIEQHRPHVICFQETKVVDEDFPAEFLDNLGYDVVYHGQKSYNGVAIASRLNLSNISMRLPDLHDNQSRVIEADIAGIRFLSVYAPNGGGREEKMQHKMEFYQKLTSRLKQLTTQYKTVIAGGDYNVAPTNDDVYDIDDYGHNNVAVSPKERKAWQNLLAKAGLQDAHAMLDGPAHDHTWWDYRQQSYALNHGLRIDHFLVAGANCKSLVVDHEPRQQERPSDHAPVILEFEA